MKKGKVFSKRHIVSATLVVCLAAAVWLNMRYSSFGTPAGNDSKNFGDGQYYDTNSGLGEAVQTSAGASQVAAARSDRNTQRNKTVEEFSAIVNNSSADEASKTQALGELNKIAERISLEASIETVIKAKGFSDALAMISEETVTVIVPAESLLTSETLQIQDAVKSQISIDLEKIIIINVK